MKARTRVLLFSLAGVGVVGSMMLLKSPKGASADPTSTLRPYERHLSRAEVTLAGVRRRFASSHGEFGLNAQDGSGRYAQIVADQLDAENKPVFSSSGRRIVSPRTD